MRNLKDIKRGNQSKKNEASEETVVVEEVRGTWLYRV